jgi:putative serine protease PepD
VTPTPQEPPEEGAEREDSASPASGFDASLRGWIDPDDRLWRHPSEVATGAARGASTPLSGIRHPRTMILIGAAATLAAIAWAIVLISPASEQPAATTASDNAPEIPVTTLALQNDQVPAPAAAAGRSVVQLQADTSHGVVSLVGVAVAEGGLVATTADGLSGLQSLWMIGTDGRRVRASFLSADGSSDLALVSVPDDLPVAQFADDATLTVGSADMTLSLTAPSDGSATLHAEVGSVTSIGTMIGSGWAKGMPSIASTAPSASSEEPGDPLLNKAGAVIGILYQAGPSSTSSTSSTPSTFLPTQLVLGVADDLRSTGKVSHGWLGVRGTTAPGSGGAEVAQLMAGSPATGVLQPGDVVVGLGGVPIRSMADLRGRLYVLASNSTIELSVLEGATTHVVDVTLGASP